jgi:hypothetical protein
VYTPFVADCPFQARLAKKRLRKNTIRGTHLAAALSVKTTVGLFDKLTIRPERSPSTILWAGIRESKRRPLSHHAGHAGATGHILLLFVACPPASQPSFRRVVLAGRHVLFWELAEPAPWKTSPLRALLKRRKNAQHITRLLGNSARASIVAECAERCSLCSARRPPLRLPLISVGQQFVATKSFCCCFYCFNCCYHFYCYYYG